MSLRIIVGKHPAKNKEKNRPRVKRIIDNVLCNYYPVKPLNYGVSYSRGYYAVIFSSHSNVAIDIEKESLAVILFSKRLRYMQDRKLWTIKECAAKFCCHGIQSILSDTDVDFILKMGRYELWKVTLDAKWNVEPIWVLYRCVNKKLHISFTVSINDFLMYIKDERDGCIN